MPESSPSIVGGWASGAAPSLIPVGSFSDQPPVLLDRPCLVVGARDGCDLQLSFSALSDVHAVIVTAAEGVFIRNLAGPGGVLVNGQPVHEQLLCNGDELRLAEFTCKVSAGETPLLPEPLPLWNFELNGSPLPPPPGRTVVIGSAPYADLRLGGPEVSPCHAMLLAADGKWRICDLASGGGTVLNGKSIRHAELADGDLLKISTNQIRLGRAAGEAALKEALAHSHVTIVSSGESFLGGMPVVLPEVAPPKGFGKVAISFGGRSLTSSRMALPVESAPPKRDEFVAVNTTQPAVVDAPAEEEQADLPVLTPAARTFPTVPKLKRVAKAAAADVEEEEPEELDSLDINDAPFGGAPLGGARGAFDVDAQGFADFSSNETASFSEDPFWDRNDDTVAPLPQREMDLTPEIPASTASVPPAAARPVAPRSAAPAATPLPRPVPVAAKAGMAPTPKRWLSRSRKAAVLKTLMAACMTGAAAGVWFGLPTHTTLEGRLTFVNIPAAGTPEAQEFQTNQLHRLEDPGLRQVAVNCLQDDYPGAEAGFLAGDGKAFAALVSSARFDASSLVMDYKGTDQTTDTQRLAAVLKAMYQSDSDLEQAVADATKALADWDPRVESRKEEIDTLDRRMALLRKRIDAAKGVDARLATLQTDAMKAGQQYAAAQQPVESDLSRLAELNARLAAGGSSAATRPAATQPAQSDMDLAELQRQIDDASEQITSLHGTTADSGLTKLQQARADSQKQLAAAMTAATAILSDHPDVRVSLQSASQLQGRIDGLIEQLLALREGDEQRLALQELVEQTQGRREQIIEDSDAKLQQLSDQLNAAQQQVVRAEALVDAASTQPTTQPALAQAAADARRTVDALQYAYQIRSQQLQSDTSARLRSRIGQLINNGTEQRMARRQLTTDTLATLAAGLDATYVPQDLSSEDRSALSKVMQCVRDLMQKQDDYAAAAAESDPVQTSLASVTERLAELKTRAATRQRVLAAAKAKDDRERATITAERDAVQARLTQDRAAMETARGDFETRALASADAGLAVFDSRQAQDALAALTETYDMKQEDIAGMERSRDDLAQRLKTTVDVKRPSAADVSVVADDDGRKLIYMILSALLVGGAFVPLMRASQPRPASAGAPGAAKP